MKTIGLLLVITASLLLGGGTGWMRTAKAEAGRADVAFETSKTASKAGAARNHTAGTRTNTFFTVGTVKFYNKEKGFGFITRDGRDPDTPDDFVRREALERAGIDSLEQNDRVSYDIEVVNGRPEVTNLKMLAEQ